MIAKVFSFFFLVLASFQGVAAELVALTPSQLETMQKQQAILIVDIRTPKEWETTELIAHSQPLQFFDQDGRYEMAQWLSQLKSLQKNPQQPLVLVCRTGNRSHKLAEMLINDLGMKPVYHLSNGIVSWIKEGKAMEKYCPPQVGCN
jgi:rhodanese-related sulfurtransferase